MDTRIQGVKLTDREACLVHLAISETTKRIFDLLNQAENNMINHPNNDKPERAADYKWQRSLKELQYRLEDKIDSDHYTLEEARWESIRES